MLSYPLKNLALICSLSLSSFSFAAQLVRPIAELDADDPLQAEFAQIDALPNEDILTMPLEMPLNEAQKSFYESYTIFKNDNNHISQKLNQMKAKHTRTAMKGVKLSTSFRLCNNVERKNKLMTIGNQIIKEKKTHINEDKSYLDSLNDKNDIKLSSNHYIKRHNVIWDYASILLAKLTAAEQEKSQLQQREQTLLAHIKNLQTFNDGPQLEGVPNAPGGVKPYLKRRNSR